MTKKPKYESSVPMLVQRTLHNTDLELRERSAVIAFSSGYATQMHFDTLLYMLNLMLIAGQTDGSRKYALDYALNTIKPALANIKQRRVDTGKFGVNAAEKKALEAMIEFSKQFWLRQTVHLYKFSCHQVDGWYDELADKASANTQYAGMDG